MQKCKNCGADIRYIATGSNSSIICDAARLPFVTDNGRQLFGYLIHECKTENNNAETRRIAIN